MCRNHLALPKGPEALSPANLPASRIDECSVPGNIPYRHAGPLPILGLGFPGECLAAERSGIRKREGLRERFVAVAPDNLTESQWESPLNLGSDSDCFRRSGRDFYFG